MTFLDVAVRRLQPEVMDQPGLDGAQHIQALRGLERINSWSGSARILWTPLRRLAAELASPHLSILDIASGGGDVPIALRRKARRAGLDWRMMGWDVSATAVAYARSRAEALGAGVTFDVRDALAEPPPATFDAVVCSLFLHHLEEEQAVSLLRNMAKLARHLLLVNDLERTPLGLLLARIGTRVLSASPIVHVDGPRSVEGAFTIAEARRLGEAAGLTGVDVRRRWPCRYLLSWRRR